MLSPWCQAVKKWADGRSGRIVSSHIMSLSSFGSREKWGNGVRAMTNNSLLEVGVDSDSDVELPMLILYSNVVAMKNNR